MTITQLRNTLHRVGAVVRRIVGVPDYPRYLAHMREHHGGEPLLSRREFFAQAIDHKYGRGRSRCC